MSTMPILPIETMVADCGDYDQRIVRSAFTTRAIPANYPGHARLRVNKPFRQVETFEQGCANYVWRILCFDLVGSGKHACMPVCADFELMEAVELRDGGRIRYDQLGYEDQQAEIRNLKVSMDALISQVEKALPPGSMKGVMRWGGLLV